MSEKLISANDVLKYTVLAGEIRNQYMEVVPAYFVREAPAVDAVEVVRCRQCKYWEPMNKCSWMDINRTDGVCRTLMEFRLAERYMTEKDHFCGYGERREEMRLIDADAFKIEFCEKCNNVSCDAPLTNTDCFTMYMLDNTPTIEAEPVRHGKWIKFHDEFSKCSLCNYPTYTGWNQTDYCPNCGAKMDGDS